MVHMDILLERPQAIYRPGELVNGICRVQLNGQMALSQLHIKLKGKADTKWTEEYTETVTDSEGQKKHETRTRTYHSKHECIEQKYNPGQAHPHSHLDPGVHDIGFSFQLPPYNLPSSFHGKFGWIKYEVKAKIEKTHFFQLEKKTKVPITIMSSAFASQQELMAPNQTSKDKKVGCFCGDPLKMKCQIQRSGFNIGTAIPVSVQVDNGSKKSMVLKASLKQDVTFRADGKTRTSDDTLADIDGNTILGSSKQNEVISVIVPASLPVTTTCCPLITIKYYLKIKLDIPGAIDLRCELPVILTNELLPVDA